MTKGYHAKIAEMDLSRGEMRTRSISAAMCRKFIGGSGFGARILYDELAVDTAPLSPENILMFMVGPFAGTKIPCSGRTSVISKSPLTGIWGEADVGGKFGDALKQLGFDGIIIKGKAQRPCYLKITANKVEIENADFLWGKDTYATHEALQEKIASRISSMAIGPAGEKMVLLSSIVSDGKDARVAARGGIGAVMGAKNLKAIVATRVKNPTPIYNEKELHASVKKVAQEMFALSENMRQYGTAGGVDACHQLQDFPLKNWQLRNWSEVPNLSGQKMAETVLTGKYHCARCPIGCGRVVQVKKGKFRTATRAGGPEYETMGALGGNLMIANIEAVTQANDLCNRLGIDTISVGQVIGFAFEAWEKGYIGLRESKVPLKWGSEDALLYLVEAIGRNEGIGEVLGQGVKKSCETLASGDPELMTEVKGLELPSHDPRAFASIALGYATSPRGACHLQAYSHGIEAWLTLPELGFDEIMERLSPTKKAELTATMQNLMSLFDSLKLCKFILYAGVHITTIVNWLNAVTGWGFTRDEFLQTGERIFNLKVLFNLREGSLPRENKLPVRFLRGMEDCFSQMLEEYYAVRGWTAQGVPCEQTLQRLELP